MTGVRKRKGPRAPKRQSGAVSGGGGLSRDSPRRFSLNARLTNPPTRPVFDVLGVP